MELNKIYLGDCIEGMRALPDDSIDLVLTSPPFKDEDVEGDYWEFYSAFFAEAWRITRNALMIIHSSTKQIEIIKRYREPKRILIWGKGLAKYSYRYNPIFVYQKGDHYKVNKVIFTDVLGVPPISGVNKSHVYQDPEVLYRALLKMMKGNQTVCDPFMGSGTTARAAISLGLDYIGWEINPQNLSVCNSLVTKSHEQGRLVV